MVLSQNEKGENKFLDLYLKFYQLKNTLRTGWMKYHGMDQKYGESIADHSFMSAVTAYLFAKELKLDLDYDKLLKMVLFHEIGEIYVGDLVSAKNREIDVNEKNDLERKAIEKIFQGMSIKDEMLEL